MSSRDDISAAFTREAFGLRALVCECGIKPEDADDVVQDVFLAAIERADDINGSLTGWLRNRARMVAKNYLRDAATADRALNYLANH